MNRPAGHVSRVTVPLYEWDNSILDNWFCPKGDHYIQVCIPANWLCPKGIVTNFSESFIVRYGCVTKQIHSCVAL